VHKVLFQYAADKDENKAALNFHLSRREKLDIMRSVNSVTNQKSFDQLLKLMKMPAKDSVSN
jgi:glycogen synthase